MRNPRPVPIESDSERGQITRKKPILHITMTTSNPDVGQSCYVVKFRTLSGAHCTTSVARQDFNTPGKVAAALLALDADLPDKPSEQAKLVQRALRNRNKKRRVLTN